MQNLGRLMLVVAVLALPLASLQAGPVARKLFSLPGAELVISASEGARIEALESGGYRVVYSDEVMQVKKQRLEIKKTFTPPRAGGAVFFEVAPIERVVAFHVWNEEGKSAYQPGPRAEGGVIDLASLNFKSSKEPFSGMVKAISLSLQIDNGPGEDAVEILKFDLE